jgi:hypothetical protein
MRKPNEVSGDSRLIWPAAVLASVVLPEQGKGTFISHKNRRWWLGLLDIELSNSGMQHGGLFSVQALPACYQKSQIPSTRTSEW